MLTQQGQLAFEIVWESDSKINLTKSHTEGYIFDYVTLYDEIPILFLRGGKYLAVGGVWDGRLFIYQLDDNQLVETYHE